MISKSADELAIGDRWWEYLWRERRKTIVRMTGSRPGSLPTSTIIVEVEDTATHRRQEIELYRGNRREVLTGDSQGNRQD